MWLCVFIYLVLRLSFFLILSRTGAFLVCLFVVFFFCVVRANEPQSDVQRAKQGTRKGGRRGKNNHDFFSSVPSPGQLLVSRAPRRLWLLLAPPSCAVLHRNILSTIKRSNEISHLISRSNSES